MIQNADEILLTAFQVAQMLQISRSMVYKLRSRGELLPRYKIFDGPKGWRWTHGDIEEFLKPRTLPPFNRADKPPAFIPVILKTRLNVA